MFFAKVSGFFILLGGIYCLWRFVIKPALEAHGIECDDEPEIEPTKYEKRRDQLLKDLELAQRDVNAMEDIEGMTVEKAEAEAILSDIEQKLKDLEVDRQ
jgi:hypothetical protein